MTKTILIILLFLTYTTTHAQILREKREGKYIGLINENDEIVIPIIYDMIKDPYGGAIVAEKDNKVGLISRDNKTILPFNYNGFMHGDSRIYLWDDKNKCGVFDKFGNNLIPCKYDYIQLNEFDHDYYLVKNKNKYGIINSNDSVVIKIEYQSIDFVGEKYISVKDSISEQWGVFDLAGKNIIPYEYIDIKPSLNDKAFIVTEATEWNKGIIATSGKEIIPIKYGKIKPLDKDTYLVESEKYSSIYGLIDTLGNMVIPFEYKEIEELSNGRRQVSKDGIHYGYINNRNEIVIKPEYTFYGFTSSNLLIVQRVTDAKWEIIDGKGNRLTQYEYDDYDYNFDTDQIILERNGKFGIVNKDELTSVLPFNYDYLSFGDNGAILAQKNDLWGFIDNKGRTLVPFIYKRLKSISKDSNAFLKDNEWTILDNSGKKPTLNTFDEIIKDEFPQTHIARKGKYYGIIDRWGNIMEDFIYDKIKRNQNVDFETCRNGKWGVISMPLFGGGRLVTTLPCEYDTISPNIGEQKALSFDLFIKKNEKWGVINSNYIVEIPCEYDSLSSISTDKFSGYITYKEGKYGMIDTSKDTTEIVLHNEYDKVEKIKRTNNWWYKEIFLKISKNSKWGLLNSDNKLAIACEYDQLIPVDSSTLKIYITSRDSKFGLIELSDNNYNITVPLIYETLEYLDMTGCGDRTYYKVRKNEKWGFIDNKGTEIIPCIYDEINISKEEQTNYNSNKKFFLRQGTNIQTNSIPLYKEEY